jgi:hypothetical protein
MAHIDVFLEQAMAIFRSRRIQMLLLSALCLTPPIIFIVWWLPPALEMRHINSLTPREVGRYFYKYHRGASQQQVEHWLDRHGIKAECYEKERGIKRINAIYVRVKTRPESLLGIQFSDGIIESCWSAPFEGACPFPPLACPSLP